MVVELDFEASAKSPMTSDHTASLILVSYYLPGDRGALSSKNMWMTLPKQGEMSISQCRPRATKNQQRKKIKKYYTTLYYIILQ